LRTILLIYQRRQAEINSANFDYFKIAKCQFALHLPESTGALLEKLLTNEDNYLKGYQIAFDLVDKELQTFTTEVINYVEKSETLKKDHPDRLEKLLSILRGQTKERLSLQFLKKNNHSDMLMIGKLKESIPAKNSMLHSAMIWMNGMMNAYTTNDSFIKDNMNWVAQATNWNRFQATATLGMIHMCNKSQANEVLEPYLRGGNMGNQGQSSPYATAGAYFAHGLIHANQFTPETNDFFM